MNLQSTIEAISPLDQDAMGQSQIHQDQLTKPQGSLGRIETLGTQLAGISGQPQPPVPSKPVVTVFAGDHGVVAQGVATFPTEVTVQMALNMGAGGAAVNVLSRSQGAEVWVIDVGVAGDVPADSGVRNRRVASGTADMSTGPAMTREQAIEALEVGISTAEEAIAAGADVLLLGEMGIGNTTPSAALISVLTGVPVREVTGSGAGASAEMVRHKMEVIEAAIATNQPDPHDAVDVLAKVGGLEHAALAGVVLAGAAARVPVVVDGVIACSAALVAVALCPEVKGYLIAGHAGVEPGILVALSRLEICPLVDLDLRLGEGTGAVLALPVIRSAALILSEMATFESASVSGGIAP